MDSSNRRAAVLREPPIVVVLEPSEVAHVAAVLILPACATQSVLPSLLSISIRCTAPRAFPACLTVDAASRPHPHKVLSPSPAPKSKPRCEQASKPPAHRRSPLVPVASGEPSAGLLVVFTMPHPSPAASCCAFVQLPTCSRHQESFIVFSSPFSLSTLPLLSLSSD
jgi:hypothetical protein